MDNNGQETGEGPPEGREEVHDEEVGRESFDGRKYVFNGGIGRRGPDDSDERPSSTEETGINR